MAAPLLHVSHTAAILATLGQVGYGNVLRCWLVATPPDNTNRAAATVHPYIQSMQVEGSTCASNETDRRVNRVKAQSSLSGGDKQRNRLEAVEQMANLLAKSFDSGPFPGDGPFPVLEG